MATHKVQFSTGGFVLHKINPPSGNGNISAWYDAQGGLIDAEYIDRRGRARPIQYGKTLWNNLCYIGQRYKAI